MRPTTRIYRCEKCKKSSEFKAPFGLMECQTKKCDHIFGGQRTQSHGINMNPMSRRTDIEFNELSVNESADRMVKASRPRTFKQGKF